MKNVKAAGDRPEGVKAVNEALGEPPKDFKVANEASEDPEYVKSVGEFLKVQNGNKWRQKMKQLDSVIF